MYTIVNFFVIIFSSNAAIQIVSSAFNVEKTAAKDIGKKAIDVGKSVVNDTGKGLVEKASKKLLTPKSQEINPKYANIAVQLEEITKNANEVLTN